MKDYWGNEALDFGVFKELLDKYTDDVFVFITKNEDGHYDDYDEEGYVLFVCDEEHEKDAHKFVDELEDDMTEKRGVPLYSYCPSVVWGLKLLAKKTAQHGGGIMI